MGQSPKYLKPVAEEAPAISGVVTGFAGIASTNRPEVGVHFQVFALKPDSAERDGAALIDVTTGEAGAWGPVQVKPGREYSFVLEKGGRTVTYFMSGLLRSTKLLNFRFLPAGAMRALGGPASSDATLLIHRPQGYLSKGRDPVTVNGSVVEELLPGVPTRDSVAVRIPDTAPKDGVRVELRGEVVHAKPAAGEHELNIVELLWD
jgi:hypothetical protein